MRVEEAKWISDQLARLDGIGPVLELGSSTLEFRTQRRPHIDALIHAPLRSRGIRVIHSDYKKDDGVDIAGDIFDRSVQDQIRKQQPRTILCCNLLEHVEDRAAVAEFCAKLLPLGGYIVFTGPYSYPIHLDPIDNYFRPTPEAVSALFPSFKVVEASIVSSKGFGQELIEEPRRIPLGLLKIAYGMLKFWMPRGKYVATNHRLLWLFRPYKICCVVLKKNRSSVAERFRHQ